MSRYSGREVALTILALILLALSGFVLVYITGVPQAIRAAALTVAIGASAILGYIANNSKGR